MRRILHHLWLLPALALILGCLIPLPARAAKAVEKKTVVGKISGPPMGTWMTVAMQRTGSASVMQVDLASAKISEKGKALKRYSLADGMRVRVKGPMRGTVLAAETVEVLERASPKKPAAGK